MSIKLTAADTSDVPPSDEHKRLERIIRDELEPLFNRGTIEDLRKVITVNYKNISSSHLASLIAERADRDFRIAPNGRLLPPVPRY